MLRKNKLRLALRYGEEALGIEESFAAEHPEEVVKMYVVVSMGT